MILTGSTPAEMRDAIVAELAKWANEYREYGDSTSSTTLVLAARELLNATIEAAP